MMTGIVQRLIMPPLIIMDSLTEAISWTVTGMLPRSGRDACPRLRFLGLSLVGLITACSALTTGPDVSSVSGAYKLVLVDGQQLPTAIESGVCPREIFDGELNLEPKVSNRRESYGIHVYARLRCDPNRILQAELRNQLSDLGRWNLDGSSVQFRSDRGNGDFSVQVQDPSLNGGVPGPTLVIKSNGREYTFRRDRLFGSRP